MWVVGLIAIALSAIFWRKGGDGQSLYRNPGVPIVIAIAKFFILGFNWWALLYILLLYGAIQGFSYGETAPIRLFWGWVFKDNQPECGLATRATCGFLWSLPAILFAILSGSWLIWGIYALFLTVANALIWYFVDDVEVNEPLVGGCVALAVFV